MKKYKIILIITIGISLAGLIPAVQAKTTHRPIEDWLYAQWDYFNDLFGYDVYNYGFSDQVSPESWLIIKMGWPWPDPDIPNFLDENGLVEGETTYEGYITERTTIDERVLVTVHLAMFNTPLTIFNWWEFFDYVFLEGERPSAILGAYEDGYMNYKLTYKFYMDEPGQPLPMPNYYENFVSFKMVGTGYGILTSHAADFGYTAGAMAMVKLHSVIMYKPDLREDHPNYDTNWGLSFMPVATIEIHEIP